MRHGKRTAPHLQNASADVDGTRPEELRRKIDRQAGDDEALAFGGERSFRIAHEGDTAHFREGGEDRVVDVALPVEIGLSDIPGGPARIILQGAVGLRVCHAAILAVRPWNTLPLTAQANSASACAPCILPARLRRSGFL